MSCVVLHSDAVTTQLLKTTMDSVWHLRPVSQGFAGMVELVMLWMVQLDVSVHLVGQEPSAVSNHLL